MFAAQPAGRASSRRSGMILGAYYLLWMLQRVVFGPLREPHGARPRRTATATAIRSRRDPAGRLARDRRPDAADGPDRR